MLNIAHEKELNTKPINRLGEMEMQNAIQTSGVGTEGTPMSVPSIRFLYRI